LKAFYDCPGCGFAWSELFDHASRCEVCGQDKILPTSTKINGEHPIYGCIDEYQDINLPEDQHFDP